MRNSNFRISKIKIHNFKNFKDLEIDLNRFNVVVGQNASGKSNFKKIFSFLNDIIISVAYVDVARTVNSYSTNGSTKFGSSNS